MGAALSLSKAIWRVRIIPSVMELERDSRRLRKNPNYFVEKHQKEAEKAQSKLQKQANKAAKENKATVGPETKEAIHNIAEDGYDMMAMESKAKSGQALINYAVYAMSNIPEVVDSSKSMEEKEIVNGIASIFNYGKVFKDATIGDLNKYDPTSPEYLTTSKYIISVKDVERYLGNEVLMSNINANKELAGKPELQVLDHTSWKQQEDGLYRPVFFHPENEIIPLVEVPTQGDLSDEMFNFLEASVNKMIIQSKHRYEMMPNGLVTLFITRDNGEEMPYILDPGIVMGRGEVSILARTSDNDTIFVPIERFLEISSRVANNDFVSLEPADVARITNDMALYPKCYTYIDMSNTEFLNSWSYDAQTDFKGKISNIVNIMCAEFEKANQAKARFRFNSHVNSNDFILISDPGVKSPLKETGETSGAIVPGYMYQVTGNIVTRIYGSMDQVQYTI